MSASTRPASPSSHTQQAGFPTGDAQRDSLAVPAHAHEAPSTSSSPVPPTPPPKDFVHIHTHHHNGSALPDDVGHLDDEDQGGGVDGKSHPAAETMAKLGLKAGPPALSPAELDVVIDISGPEHDGDGDGAESTVDPDATLRASMDAARIVDGDSEVDADADVMRSKGAGAGAARDLDEDGETEEGGPREADITAASVEHGSTVYGSGAGSMCERERGDVQEHPLRLDVHPPSPPLWAGADDAERGRLSPQRFEFSVAKTRAVHDFPTKPRSTHNRPLIPHSAYYFGPPPPDSAYGTDPVGQIGVHHPREVVRIERDYSGGELPQFLPTYPLELEGRITPTQFLETINAVNEILLSAHSLGHAFVDNALAFFSLQTSRALKKTHYEKEMERLKAMLDALNVQIYNPVGLHIRWPRPVAFLFLEIEYYATFHVHMLSVSSFPSRRMIGYPVERHPHSPDFLLSP
ncbi:Golgin subfamily A member 7/ERF4 family-domain-containing protein [Trametes elegans]|nr:Golgin subfamily A member 7/ERF4 family-domain-containing protein [Trametes elegans]